MLERSGLCVQFQQVRYLSRRRLAYPSYPFKRLTKQNPKAHDTNLKYAMKQFLGPRNYKGEYKLNKYFDVELNHQPNYIKPDFEKGVVLQHPVTKQPLVVDPNEGFSSGSNKSNKNNYSNNNSTSKLRLVATDPPGALKSVKERRLLQPFPENPHCFTNKVISDNLKAKIYQDLNVNGLTSQQVSQKIGLKVPRVEAINRLYKLEYNWEKNNRITPDMKKMSNIMYKLFPIFKTDLYRDKENLTEISVPKNTLNSRFITIAESEPFGPIDAANLLDLEPAEKISEQLALHGEHKNGQGNNFAEKKGKKIIYGKIRQGDRSIFKFSEAKVGHVGVRYGKANRDNKKDRGIGFDHLGRMIYI